MSTRSSGLNQTRKPLPPFRNPPRLRGGAYLKPLYSGTGVQPAVCTERISKTLGMAFSSSLCMTTPKPLMFNRKHVTGRSRAIGAPKMQAKQPVQMNANKRKNDKQRDSWDTGSIFWVKKSEYEIKIPTNLKCENVTNIRGFQGPGVGAGRAGPHRP